MMKSRYTSLFSKSEANAITKSKFESWVQKKKEKEKKLKRNASIN